LSLLSSVSARSSLSAAMSRSAIARSVRRSVLAINGVAATVPNTVQPSAASSGLSLTVRSRHQVMRCQVHCWTVVSADSAKLDPNPKAPPLSLVDPNRRQAASSERRQNGVDRRYRADTRPLARAWLLDNNFDPVTDCPILKYNRSAFIGGLFHSYATSRSLRCVEYQKGLAYRSVFDAVCQLGRRPRVEFNFYEGRVECLRRSGCLWTCSMMVVHSSWRLGKLQRSVWPWVLSFGPTIDHLRCLRCARYARRIAWLRCHREVGRWWRNRSPRMFPESCMECGCGSATVRPTPPVSRLHGRSHGIWIRAGVGEARSSAGVDRGPHWGWIRTTLPLRG
jgi:hypothetical protein